MAEKTISMTDQLYQYLIDFSLQEHPVLRRLREYTQTREDGMMQIAPEQGQFMALLATLIQAKKTLDVGVFTGYSALVIALALPIDGQIIACDIRKDHTDIAKKYWEEAGVQHKIDLKIAPAGETLQCLIDAGQADTFDLAFVDADKQGYPDYYEKCLKLIRPGGLIILDNMFRGGKVADLENIDQAGKVLRNLQQKIHHDSRVNQSLAPIADGLLLIQKK
jgi:caffeoyl-CoA O-methyltransferase